MKTVLIVDDDFDAREILKRILETKGFSVALAENGKKALKLLEENRAKFDLFVLDIMMPEMDGYQLLEHIRNMDEYSSTPVMMISAKDRDTDVLDGYKQGADYYITKPFSPKHIEWGLKLFFEQG